VATATATGVLIPLASIKWGVGCRIYSATTRHPPLGPTKRSSHSRLGRDLESVPDYPGELAGSQSDVVQIGRDVLVGIPKTGYAPYTYPHPLTLGSVCCMHCRRPAGSVHVLRELERFFAQLPLAFPVHARICRVQGARGWCS
jgi:hypothetical protein